MKMRKSSIKMRVLLASALLCMASAPAFAQTFVVAACPSATAIGPAGSRGALYAIDVNGNVCMVSSLGASSAIIGKVGIDQTTPGTTNGTSIVGINAATALAGNGATGTGSLRVTIANDNTAPTTWPTAANQTATQAPVAPGAATATKSDLIGCQATSAAINPTTGQQAAVPCDLNNNVLTSPGGAPNLTTAQVTVTTSSTSVVAARALRRNVTITNITGTQQVFCSGTTATTSNGQLIPAVVGASWNVSTTAAINCIAVTASQTVSTSETF